MKLWPIKFRETAEGRLVIANDAGDFFEGSQDFLDRYIDGSLCSADRDFLHDNGFAYAHDGDSDHIAFAYRWSQRFAAQSNLSYFILVPTLRCNLTCSYCQVSRAAETARGFDWDEKTLAASLSFIKQQATDTVKIEFQGGEPLLRLDHLKAVRDACRRHFRKAEFVVCTNLQRVSQEAWEFLEAEDTYVSTSLDGDFATHSRQRTKTTAATYEFSQNLHQAAARLGPTHLSALPTINIDQPPDLNALLDQYQALGIKSVYFRPINYQGFARKLLDDPDNIQAWRQLYSRFIDTIIARNSTATSNNFFEEYYFTHCLRKVVGASHGNHVDIRNPSLFAADYLVIDFDGSLYPSDEARMVTRTGQVDLKIGTVFRGLDQDAVGALNAMPFNNTHEDCIHCPYQPYCGTDYVDDISRYRRVDLPKANTWFCNRHLSVFDKVFSLIYSPEPAVQASLANWLGLASWPINAFGRIE